MASLNVEEQAAFRKELFGDEQLDIEVEGLTITAPVEGCLAEARAKIAGEGDLRAGAEFSALSTQASMIQNQIDAMTVADSAYIEALEEWVSCFAAAGFKASNGQPFANPTEAEIHAVDTLWPDISDGVSTEETKMAAADLACRLESRLHDVYQEKYLEHERTVIDSPETQAFLFTWRERNQLAARSAALTLAEEGIPTK